MTGPLGKSEFCFPRDQSLSVYCYRKKNGLTVTSWDFVNNMIGFINPFPTTARHPLQPAAILNF